VFLTGALHEPIMDMLSHELWLDIDPAKCVIRFSPRERQRRFGEEGTPAYVDAVRKHRAALVAKLVAFTNKFIDGQCAHISPTGHPMNTQA
jgi:hypothetical protein